MCQIHRRFTDEQVRVLFQGYCQGQLRRTDVQDLLGIKKSRSFALLKVYRQDPETFTVADVHFQLSLDTSLTVPVPHSVSVSHSVVPGSVSRLDVSVPTVAQAREG